MGSENKYHMLAMILIARIRIVANHIARIGPWKMMIERGRVELGKNINLRDITIDAITKRDIDQHVIGT